jgi:hypothetical protein
MTRTRTLEDKFESMFNGCGNYTSDNNSYTSFSDDSNIFKLYEVVDITDRDNIEIPCNLLGRFEAKVINDIMANRANFLPSYPNRIIVDLTSNYLSRTIKKTGSSIISDIITKVYNNPKALHVVNADDDVYYGNSCILFDKNFNVLYYTTTRATYNNEKSKYNYTNSVLYVNSSVFANQKNTVNKLIIQRMIPYLLSIPSVTRMVSYYSNAFENRYYNIPVEVCIKRPEFFNTIIQKPVLPKTMDINDELNKLVQVNLDNIFRIN